MQGLMQHWPLLCHRVLEHASREHGQRRVVTRSVEGPIEVTNYRDIHSRALRVSQALVKHGIRAGDRVATLAWSTARHLECWYGIAGAGAIYHPLNPRLFSEQIVYIAQQAADRLLFLDTTFVSLVEQMADRLPSIECFVILTSRMHMPKTTLKNAIAYDEWLAQSDGDFVWADFDEQQAASLVYTSGTTGHPKGVLLSHRSVVLMSLTANAPDMYGFSSTDIVLQVPPMCHANGWTWPFTALMAGASLIFPGARLDPASLTELLVSERVTCTGGVPTVWQGVLEYLSQQSIRLTDLKRVYIGGSPCPQPMIEAFEQTHAAEVRSSMGMTEMGPLSGICTLTPDTRDKQGDELTRLKQSQGRVPFLVQYRTVNAQGVEVPRGESTMGCLQAKGPCVLRAYYDSPEQTLLNDDGFFDTGDIATIDRHGYLYITDRAKDLVKSGGEWISSIDLENTVMTHPLVQEAAVIGVKHPKWDERPLLIIVTKPGAVLTGERVVQHLNGKIAKWWLPDAIIFVESIPHTSIGKINKALLRTQYADFLQTSPPV